jgi:hypothetical protein
MAKARSTRFQDSMRLAKTVGNVISGQRDEGRGKQQIENRSPPTADEIRRVMSALGKLGGPKGGEARAAKLSKKRRIQIARDAASVRWGKK